MRWLYALAGAAYFASLFLIGLGIAMGELRLVGPAYAVLVVSLLALAYSKE